MELHLDQHFSIVKRRVYLRVVPLNIKCLNYSNQEHRPTTLLRRHRSRRTKLGTQTHRVGSERIQMTYDPSV